jgi:hypothetical protein
MFVKSVARLQQTWNVDKISTCTSYCICSHPHLIPESCKGFMLICTLFTARRCGCGHGAGMFGVLYVDPDAVPVATQFPHHLHVPRVLLHHPAAHQVQVAPQFPQHLHVPRVKVRAECGHFINTNTAHRYHYAFTVLYVKRHYE